MRDAPALNKVCELSQATGRQARRSPALGSAGARNEVVSLHVSGSFLRFCLRTARSPKLSWYFWVAVQKAFDYGLKAKLDAPLRPRSAGVCAGTGLSDRGQLTIPRAAGVQILTLHLQAT